MNTQLTDGLSIVFQVTDINMPQLKQPMTLEDKGLQACVNLYCGTCKRWLSKLRQAQKTSSSAYRNMTSNVLVACLQIERSISEFPYSIIEMMSPQLTRKFAEMIEFYNYEYRYSNPRFGIEERHNNVCTAMFRSVLTPYVYKYDKNTCWGFIERLVLQTLDSVPGLRTLHLTIPMLEDESAQLAKVRHLQAFTYMLNCTDEVIEQLGLHCTDLKRVSLFGSNRVTNASVQHLLQLKKLHFLNLDGTQIDSKHYGLLLSELPQIKDISFNTMMGEDILNHVAEKDLHKISHARGSVRNISRLAQRCRYITNLDIQVFGSGVDLSSLAALTTLRNLTIVWVNVTSNVNTVLTGIGPRLTDLTLKHIKSVDLQDIVTLCPLLASLSLLDCTLLPSDPNTPLDAQLPHFRNLISLRITDCDEEETNYNYIRHYVSLKKIHLTKIRIFTVEFMREVVRSGTLAHLEEIRVEEYRPGHLTVEALEMLIEHCSYLKSIGILSSFSSLKCELIEKFRRWVLLRNFDLQVIP
jgi:hypothetical protein